MFGTEQNTYALNVMFKGILQLQQILIAPVKIMLVKIQLMLILMDNIGVNTNAEMVI
jgi:hypothetical protein